MRWRDVKQNKSVKKVEKNTPKLTLPYAPIPDRIKAFITDAFLLSMPLFYIVIYFVFDGLKGAEGVEGHRMEAWLFILVPLGIIVSLFYTKTGQTPGMKAHNLKLIDNNTKEKPSFLMAILRYFFFNIAFFSVIGVLLSFFREDKRGLQDLLSGTSIIKVADA
jgi:uncharacterized RDD family membrane protein YckC